MKRNKCFAGIIFLSVLILFGVWNHDSVARLVSGVVAHNHSSSTAGGSNLSGTTLSGTTTVSGTLTSTKACASGFTRAGPNFCVRTDSVSTTPLTRDACTVITKPDSSANALLVHFELNARGANISGALRSSEVGVWNATCDSTRHSRVFTAGFEFNATTSDISMWKGNVVIPTIGSIAFLFQDDAGNVGLASYQIRGYFD